MEKTIIDFPFKVKMKPIKIKVLFEERRKAEVQEQILTKKQKEWIEKGIKLDKFFKIKFSCMPVIKDFFRKILHNYFKTKNRTCELCNKKFDSIHLFTKCDIVKKWEIKIYGSEKRKKRIRYAFYNIKTTKGKKYLLTHSVLLNWAIWLTRNYIILIKDEEKKNKH